MEALQINVNSLMLISTAPCLVEILVLQIPIANGMPIFSFVNGSKLEWLDALHCLNPHVIPEMIVISNLFQIDVPPLNIILYANIKVQIVVGKVNTLNVFWLMENANQFTLHSVKAYQPQHVNMDKIVFIVLHVKLWGNALIIQIRLMPVGMIL